MYAATRVSPRGAGKSSARGGDRRRPGLVAGRGRSGATSLRSSFARSGMTPIRSVAGVAEAVPLRTFDSAVRTRAGGQAARVAALTMPCSASAAPAMIGLAPDVPLKLLYVFVRLP